MHTSSIRAASLLAMSLVFCLVPSWSPAANPSDPVIVWDRVVGITPAAGFTGQFIEGISPVGFPWTVEHGRAQVNLSNHRYHIFIQGLAIGAMPTPLSPIGTTGVVTSVRGAFVCTGGGPVVETDSVELSSAGDAYLKGRLTDDLEACDPGNLVFLVRVASVLPGAPDITGSWLAYGASRRLGNLET